VKVAIKAATETCSKYQQQCTDVVFTRLRAGKSIRTTFRDVGVNGLAVAPSELSLGDDIDVGCVADYRSIPVVLLGDLDNIGANLIALLNRSGNPRIHLDHYDDEKRLPEFLLAYSPCREQWLYREEIRRRTEALPARTAAAILHALREYPVTAWVQRAAQRAGLSERKFRDDVTGCGIRDPRLIFWGSRTVNAHGFAQDPGFSDVSIARKCGYERAESLLDSLRRIGVNDLVSLAELTSEQVMAMVLGVVLE
jgi:hypothetical protein